MGRPGSTERSGGAGRGARIAGRPRGVRRPVRGHRAAGVRGLREDRGTQKGQGARGRDRGAAGGHAGVAGRGAGIAGRAGVAGQLCAGAATAACAENLGAEGSDYFSSWGLERGFSLNAQLRSFKFREAAWGFVR